MDTVAFDTRLFRPSSPIAQYLCCVFPYCPTALHLYSPLFPLRNLSTACSAATCALTSLYVPCAFLLSIFLFVSWSCCDSCCDSYCDSCCDSASRFISDVSFPIALHICSPLLRFLLLLRISTTLLSHCFITPLLLRSEERESTSALRATGISNFSHLYLFSRTQPPSARSCPQWAFRSRCENPFSFLLFLSLSSPVSFSFFTYLYFSLLLCLSLLNLTHPLMCLY